MARHSPDIRPGFGLIVVALVAISACTLGPEPKRPVTAAQQAESFVNSTGDSTIDAPELRSRWWETFGDPATTELVLEALENNTDLMVAAARVLEAEATLKKAGAGRWPQLAYGAGASRTKNSFVLPQVGRVSIYSTTYNTDLDVSYVVDLFGRLKRTRQAAWASLLGEEAAAEAVMHSVIAAVVRARVQVATAEDALSITRRIRLSWKSTLATVERRYRSGLVGAVDLYLARENYSSARASETAIEGSLRQAHHALDVLVGRRAGTGPQLQTTLPGLPDLEPVPLGLPVELLDRRPDLRQAEAGFVAATYGVGAALADLYPSVTLSGSAGNSSDTLGELFSSKTRIYQAVLGLVGPLFTGGERRAELAASRARMEQAAAAYAGAVLQAIREVEDSLVAVETINGSLGHTQRRVTEARAADRLARDRYTRGVETLLRVLETERRLRLAEEALITTKADLWNARIDLFLALGGDWYPADPGRPGPRNDDQVVAAVDGEAETRPMSGENVAVIPEKRESKTGEVS